MRETAGQGASVAQITVRCACGQPLLVRSDFLGNRVQCPACKASIFIPRPAILPRTGPQAEEDSGAFSKGTLITLWSLLGIAAVAALAFMLWYSRSAHQARINDVNRKVTSAVAAATDWLANGSPSEGENVERALSGALEIEDSTNKASGEPILAQVRQRRQELTKQARIREAQQAATTGRLHLNSCSA